MRLSSVLLRCEAAPEYQLLCEAIAHADAARFFGILARTGNELATGPLEARNAANSANWPLPNSVKYFDPYVICWSIIHGGNYPVDCGDTSNRLYVTFEQPSLTLNYETVYELACKSANNATTSDSAGALTWADIEDGDVARLDGARFSYWKPPETVFQSLPEPLASLSVNSEVNGACGAFADLLRGCFDLHGIATYFTTITLNAVNPDAHGFLINRWTVQDTAVSAGPNGRNDNDALGNDFPLFQKGNGLPRSTCIQYGLQIVRTL